MIKKIILTSLFGLSFSCPLIAIAMEEGQSNASLPLYVGAYGGYGAIDGGYGSDGNFAQGRLALGINAKEYKMWMFGGELGVQSGNTMRLAASSTVVDPTFGLPPQAVLKPLVDLLFTVKGQIPTTQKGFYILKGGIAYRQLQLQDRTSSSDSLNKVAGEFQAGVGVNIAPHVLLSLVYQGIYSHSNAGVTLDSDGGTSIAYIPTQQAGFLGIEYSLA